MKINMTPPARSILRGGFMVAIALLLFSALFLYKAMPLSLDTYEFFALSETMRQTCSAILFFAIFGSAYAQDMSGRKK
ncbi:MAG: hypothetical protein FWG36_02715 [Oscillospiraceae bacterium]|nr:hypothetical protein [Oscillospiraceae bacterium]